MSALWQIPNTRLIVVLDDPGIPSGQTNDPYAGLSEELAEAGKAIGTASLKGNVGERDRFLADNKNSNQVRVALQMASANAGRSLNAVYGITNEGLRRIIREWQAGDIERSAARKQSSRLFRESYERVRQIARKASGLERLGYGEAVFREEETWFRSAVREEIKYFHTFMEDIHEGNANEAAVDRRIAAYVRALRFMYESARIQAMPGNVLLYWRGPKKADDPKVCSGCEFMMENSPYPKDTIPAVPRDGSTQCLTNCRHRIQIRVVQNMNDVVQRRNIIERRDKLVKKLKQIKEQAGLGRRAPTRTGGERNPFAGSRVTTHRAPPRQRRRRRR